MSFPIPRATRPGSPAPASPVLVFIARSTDSRSGSVDFGIFSRHASLVSTASRNGAPSLSASSYTTAQTKTAEEAQQLVEKCQELEEREAQLEAKEADFAESTQRFRFNSIKNGASIEKTKLRIQTDLIARYSPAQELSPSALVDRQLVTPNDNFNSNAERLGHSGAKTGAMSGLEDEKHAFALQLGRLLLANAELENCIFSRELERIKNEYLKMIQEAVERDQLKTQRLNSHFNQQLASQQDSVNHYEAFILQAGVMSKFQEWNSSMHTETLLPSPVFEHDRSERISPVHKAAPATLPALPAPEKHRRRAMFFSKIRSLMR